MIARYCAVCGGPTRRHDRLLVLVALAYYAEHFAQHPGEGEAIHVLLAQLREEYDADGQS